VQPVPRLALKTTRLISRPSAEEDVSRAFEIRSDWEVSRMLRIPTFPPNYEDINCWFRQHREEWADGKAYRFAILDQSRMVGLVDIESVADGEGVLGYWLEREAWGQGFAFEAAAAVVRFAFETVGLSKIRAAHASDNQASGAALRKLGFARVSSERRFSHSRREDLTQVFYVLRKPS
jgi:ribosomal-protein-alanine N-acetyltransferase